MSEVESVFCGIALSDLYRLPITDLSHVRKTIVVHRRYLESLRRDKERKKAYYMKRKYGYDNCQ